MSRPAAEAGGPRPQRMLARERAALALLALSGAAFLPGALNRFVFPKLLLVAVGVGLAARVPARGRLPRGAVGPLAVGAGVLVLAALTSRAPLRALIGLPPRYEGVMVLTLYAGSLLAGARLLGHGRARGSSRWFLSWLALAALAIGLEAALEATGLRPLQSNVSRPGSLLGNASDEGAWALLALGPLAAAALRVGGGLFSAGALAAAATVALSASRGALVGALALCLVLVLLERSRALRVVLAVGVVALVALSLALPATRARLTGSGDDATHTVTGRLLLWQESVRLLAARPLLGVGPSGYLDAIPRYHTATYEREVGPQNPPDSPHNWLLQAAMAGGLPLLLIALWLAALTLVRGYRATLRQPTGGESAVVGGLLAGLVGYGVALLFTPTSPGTTPLAALYAGALLAGLEPPPPVDHGASLARARLRAWWRTLALAACGALTVLMASAAAAELPLRAAIDDAARGHLAASRREFELASAFRPWDVGVAAIAAHAYATLAADGFSSAIPYGMHFSAIVMRAWPDDVGNLTDAATLADAASERDWALALIRRALALEPANPLLLRFERTLSG